MARTSLSALLRLVACSLSALDLLWRHVRAETTACALVLTQLGEHTGGGSLRFRLLASLRSVLALLER